MHYLTSILKAMKASSDNSEPDGDNEEDGKLSNSEEVQNELALCQQIQKLRYKQT